MLVILELSYPNINDKMELCVILMSMIIWRAKVMVFNSTFNNISVISWLNKWNPNTNDKMELCIIIKTQIKWSSV